MEEIYFSFPCRVNVSVEAVPCGEPIPSAEEAALWIPKIAEIAGTVPAIDYRTQKALRKYEIEFSKLLDHVNELTDKINSIVCYLLGERAFGKETKTTALSGGGFSFLMNGETGYFEKGDAIRACFIDPKMGMAFAAVAEISSISGNEASAKFLAITEENREMAIRIITEEQRKALQARAAKRAEKNAE